MIAFLNFGYLLLLAVLGLGGAFAGFVIGKERGRNEAWREFRKLRQEEEIQREIRKLRRQRLEREEYLMDVEEGGLRLETPRPGRNGKPPRRGGGHGHDRAHPPH